MDVALIIITSSALVVAMYAVMSVASDAELDFRERLRWMQTLRNELENMSGQPVPSSAKLTEGSVE